MAGQSCPLAVGDLDFVGDSTSNLVCQTVL